MMDLSSCFGHLWKWLKFRTRDWREVKTNFRISTKNLISTTFMESLDDRRRDWLHCPVIKIQIDPARKLLTFPRSSLWCSQKSYSAIVLLCWILKHFRVLWIIFYMFVNNAISLGWQRAPPFQSHSTTLATNLIVFWIFSVVGSFHVVSKVLTKLSCQLQSLINEPSLWAVWQHSDWRKYNIL